MCVEFLKITQMTAVKSRHEGCQLEERDLLILKINPENENIRWSKSTAEIIQRGSENH